MTLELGIPFPSEAEALRKEASAIRHWTPQQRWQAVVDTIVTAEALSRAGTVREAQLRYQQRLEDEWRRRMKEFIQQHAAS